MIVIVLRLFYSCAFFSHAIRRNMQTYNVRVYLHNSVIWQDEKATAMYKKIRHQMLFYLVEDGCFVVETVLPVYAWSTSEW